MGFSLGVGTTVAAAHQVRKRVNRYQPSAMANRVTDSLSSLRDQVAAAVDEGGLRPARASRSCANVHRAAEEPRPGNSRRGRYDLSRGGAPNG